MTNRVLIASLLPLTLVTGCNASAFAPVNSSSAVGDLSRAAQPAIVYRLLHSFGRGSDGVTPVGELVDLDGKLYGVTEYGGKYGNGSVFRIAPGGAEIVVHSFGKRPDGEHPADGLVVADGVLYGTTRVGGEYDTGTVFRITYNKGTYTEKVIHDFGSGGDGSTPMARLLAVTHGNTTELYGTTSAGGAHGGGGTAFELRPKGKNAESVIHSFGLDADGTAPLAGLIAVNGSLYGTTSAGGGTGDGTIFRMSMRGFETILADLDCTNGKEPVARMTAVGDTLYGTAEMGGASACATNYGSVFSIDTGGVLRTVYDFGATPAGENPEASLTATNGTFYSTTYDGGKSGFGTIFSLTPAGGEKDLHDFAGTPDGAYPLAAPLRFEGEFYGTTSSGGKYGGGIVYAFTHY